MKILFSLQFILLCAVSYSQQSVNIFNAKILSKDVNGRSNFYHTNFPASSKLINPGMQSDNIYAWLGNVYLDNNVKQLRSFMNLSNQELFQPLLDSIDMDFYSTYALRNVLDAKYRNSAREGEYKVFRKAFQDAKTNQEKKNILLEFDNYQFFEDLQKAKYEVNVTPFKNNTEVERQIKFGITASVDTLFLSEYLKGSAKLKADILNLVDKDIKVTGMYYEMGYSIPYRSKVAYYLNKKYAPAINAIKNLPNKDQFTDALIDFYNSPNTGLVAGATVFSVAIEYNVERISQLGIGLMVKANIEVPEVEMLKISAELLASLGIDKRYAGEARAEKIFCLTYAYDSEIEKFGVQP